MTGAQLTVRSVRCTAIVVPLRRALGTSAARMEQGPFVLVELETEQGVRGCAYVYCYLPAAAPLIRRVIDTAAETLIGARVDPAEISRSLDARFKLIGVHGIVRMGIAAIDVACWDALALAADQPLAVLLGGTRDTIPAYNSNGLSIKAPEALGDEALELLEPGFAAVKLRLGREDGAQDLAAAEAVRAAIGEEIALMADFNQALDRSEAVERGIVLEAARLAWLEEPVAADDLRGSAAVAAALETPVQIGENLYGPNTVASAIALHAADYLMFDPMRIGGVTGWLAASRLAQDAGVQVSSHLYPELSAHLLAATPTAHWLEYVDWAEPFLCEGVRLEGGGVRVPDAPGSGMVWDVDAVARYAVG